jgi:glycosidase
MFLGNRERGYAPFATDHDTFSRMRDLIAMRKEHVALRRGETQILWSTDRAPGESDAGIFAYSRVANDQTLVAVLNTSDDATSRTCAPQSLGGACMAVPFAPGTVLKDVAPGGDGTVVTVGADGTVAVEVGPRGGRLLSPVF